MSWVLVGAALWSYHARTLDQETAGSVEAPRQAFIRWLYGYLVAAVGLATFAIGVAGTAATLLDMLGQPFVVRPTAWWQDRVSVSVTLVAVGLPVWLAYWLPLQRDARDMLARHSLPRRIYLFLVFGATVVTLLVTGVVCTYQLVRLVLGEAWTTGQTTDTLQALSAFVVAAALLAYHLRALPREAESAAPGTQQYGVTLHFESHDPFELEAYLRQVREMAPPGIRLTSSPVALSGERPLEVEEPRAA
jgi:hypothetical protein